MHKFLRKYIKKTLLTGISVWLLASAWTSCYAMPEIMPLTQVQEGMQGVAYTVVDQSGEIKSFDVDIVGVVSSGKGGRSLIMARGYGEVIENAGGVLHGMSGSPVYVDGLLVGAVSSGIKDLTPFTFFITPIEDMMAIWNMPDNKNLNHVEGVDLKQYAEDRAKAEAEKKAKEEKEAKAKAEKEAKEEKDAKDGTTAKKSWSDMGDKFKTLPKQESAKPDEAKAADAAADVSKPVEVKDESARAKDDAAGAKDDAAGAKDDAAKSADVTADAASADTAKTSAANTDVANADVAKPAEANAAELTEEKPAEAQPADTETEAGNTEASEAKASETEDNQQAAPEEAAKNTQPEPAQTMAVGDKKSRLYFTGFNRQGLSYLDGKLPGFDSSDAYPIGQDDDNMSFTNYNAELEPGSAVGAGVMYGDFSVVATGTVTAVDDQRILAFGHSFMHQGNVNFFMTDAEVVGTYSGISDPGIKVANVGRLIGRVNQDREAGIAGIVGQFPQVVPVKVNIKNDDLGIKESFSSRIAYDESYIPTLSAGMAYAVMNRVVDTTGGGTADIRFTIHTDAMENGQVERRNIYYNAADVGKVAVNELTQALTIICNSKEKEENITEIQVDIEVSSNRHTASVVSAVPDKPQAKPGETVVFKTTLKPYRAPEVVINIPYTIPETQIPGPLNLDFRGGGLVPMSMLAALTQPSVMDKLLEDQQKKTTAEQLKELLEMNCNNEIVVSPGLPEMAEDEATQRKQFKESIKAAKKAQQALLTKKKKPRSARKVDLLGVNKNEGKDDSDNVATGCIKATTDYIIDNVAHVLIKVEKPD